MKHLLILIFFLAIPFVQGIGQNTGIKEIPRDTSYTPYQSWLKIRKHYPEARIAYPHLPENVSAYHDQVYAVLPETPFGRRELHADLFCPKAEGKFPALIMVHGGGWSSGNKSMQVPMAQMIAAKGFVTVAVEYQLTPEAKYPAAVYNIKAAIRWMRAHADEYHINPERIYISGCSAGGQLAALVGMTNGVPKFEGTMGNPGFSSAVQGIIDVDGVIDFLAPWSLNKIRKPHSADCEWLGGCFEDKPAVWKEASAIFWANEKSVPVLFLNSGFPRFHAGQDELIGMMKEWGIYTEVHKFDLQMHPFWLFHPWMDTAVDDMVAFMERK